MVTEEPINVVATRHSRALQVLLVEDDAHAARVILRGFRGSGVTVKVLRTVAETRQFLHAASAEIDVVLLDCMHRPIVIAKIGAS